MTLSSLPEMSELCMIYTEKMFYLQTINVPSQIEITLLTGRDEQSIRKMLITSSQQMNLEHLRKITTVCVSDPDRVMRESAALLSKSGGDDWTKNESLSQMTSSQAELGMHAMDYCDYVSSVSTLELQFHRD